MQGREVAPYDFNDFLKEWSQQFNKVKFILSYLHTYPVLLKKLKFDDLISPEELDEHQKDWVWLVSKYEGMEKDFFRPFWVPLGKHSLDYFIDLSDPEFPIFEIEYFFFEPYRYYKNYLFYKVSDLLISSENDINCGEYHYNRVQDILRQADIYFEERRRLGYPDFPTE